MVLHYPVQRLQYVCLGAAKPAKIMDSEQKLREQQKTQQQHSPVGSPRECSPRSASGHEAESSPSPARLCVAEVKPVVKFPAAVTGASSAKPPQAAAPQPTHTSFMISDILHSTSSSKNVRHPTTTTLGIPTNHAAAVPYPASYPASSADDSAYSEGRDSPRSVVSDDADCKEREGSVGASDSDVERTGERLKTSNVISTVRSWCSHI